MQAQLNKLERIVKRHIYFHKAYRFLNTGGENKSFIAYEVARGRRSWPYKFSYSAVLAYENHKSSLNEELLQAIKPSHTSTSPSLLKLAADLNLS